MCPPQLPQHQSAAENCPAGFSWYSCSINKFGGCCSVDPCAEGGTCPDIKQPLTPATSSTLAPAVTTHSVAHPPTLTSAEVSMSSTETPRVVISVGAPLAVSATPNSLNPTVTPITFVTIAVTHPADSTPLTSAPSPPPSAIPAAAANNTGDNNSQSFPIGLIAGIVTGFSILILVMSALFVFLWRNKRIKVISDDEATELRDRRRGAATRAYYMPQPPTPQQQRMVATGGGGGGGGNDDASPKHVRAAPPEVVTPRRVATSSPRRSSCSIDTNKPWPLTPLASVYRSSPSPLREGASGRAHAITQPDQRRANWPILSPAGFHAVSFTPNHAALDQRPPSYPIQGPCTPEASTTILTNPDDTINNGQQQQRTSELARTSSVLYALSPPPRRPRQSDASSGTENEGEVVVGVAKTSEGYIGATPSLRLSGCGGSSLEVNNSHQHHQHQDEHAEDMSSVVSHSVSQRKTWCGEGGDGDQTSSLSGCGPSANRRCSQ